jgi:signal peptidase II
MGRWPCAFHEIGRPLPDAPARAYGGFVLVLKDGWNRARLWGILPGMKLAHARVAILVASLLLVGCDHVTKHVAKTGLEGRPPHALVGSVLDLSYTENTDSGFGLLRWVPVTVRTPLLTALQLVAGAAFFGLALGRGRSRWVRLALLLISAGALGNGVDRLARGYVVDFIHLHHWPVFNLADIYITIGAILLAIALRGARPDGPAQEHQTV